MRISIWRNHSDSTAISRSLVVGLLIGWAAAVPAHADELLDVLSRMRGQYESIESVHLLATANISLARDPEGTAAFGRGSFEYWAQGESYRIECRTPPRLGFASDVDVAFDGQMFQLLMREMDTLSIRGGDARQLPVALPNPFFLPLDFVSPQDPACDGCVLRLTDLENLELWDERMAGARLETLAGSDEKGRRTLSIPGGTVDGEPTRYLLSVEGPGRSARVRRIDRLNSEGDLLLTIDFDGFRGVRGGILDFPHEIRVKVFDPESDESVMELEYLVEVLEVNPSIPDDVFALRPGEGVRVWDSDAHRFLDPIDPKQPETPGSGTR